MDWTFQQLEGPSADRKMIVLSGWYAPFGRPRKEPILKEIIKSRVQTTRYPGASGQTRHAFGTNTEPFELKGRWMSKAGSELANDLADRWKAFVKDERTCRIAWGNIISWTGFVEELELGRESEHEIAWRMRILIDGTDDEPKRPAPRFRPTQSLEQLTEIFQFLAGSKRLQASALPDLQPDFLDSLDNLAAELNKPAALMNKIAGDIDGIEKKTFGTIQHFRGAITGMRTAILTMRDVVINTEIDSVLVSRSAESDIAWLKYSLDFDTESANILDQLNALDRNAELALKNDASKFIVARDGDTWESISTRATGGPEKAGDIRSLNGARYGEKPVPGVSYFVQ